MYDVDVGCRCRMYNTIDDRDHQDVWLYDAAYAQDDDSLQPHLHRRAFDCPESVSIFQVPDSRFQITERIRIDTVPEDQPRRKQIRLQKSKRGKWMVVITMGMCVCKKACKQEQTRASQQKGRNGGAHPINSPPLVGYIISLQMQAASARTCEVWTLPTLSHPTLTTHLFPFLDPIPNPIPINVPEVPWWLWYR